MYVFAPVFLLVPMAVGIVFAALLAVRLLAPRAPDIGDKRMSYECGEVPIGDARVRYNLRFYTIALLFLLFDVEIAMTLPAAVVFRRVVAEDRPAGAVALAALVLFLGILVAGLGYLLRKGDLEWIRTWRKSEHNQPDGSPASPPVKNNP
ncbi:MAG: NADH-quinone oxidoreductase subunit A [Planctomycetota bacterium]